ncbi:MAG: NYN domain-containing protein [Nitrospirae bacterium]|nr:NYN domain-containing protein [Nitrospirota bacterium]
MSRLIIDGYNLIGTQHRDLASQRNRLVKRLVRYRAVRGHDITVVFDGHGGLSPMETIGADGGVRIIFSRIARKADDVIKEMLVREKDHFIVISSDREIADFAWARGSVPVDSEAFLRKLEGALTEEKGPAGEDLMDDLAWKMLADEEEETVRSSGKGSSRRPSKRRKAVDRALKKL